MGRWFYFSDTYVGPGWVVLGCLGAIVGLAALAYGLYFLLGWAFDLGDKL